uniref:APC membrane recruitment protein 1 n=1 Tax=Mastacembelus armatus TaxID=205130 RepID=A0A3Q3LSS8_9TELE
KTAPTINEFPLKKNNRFCLQSDTMTATVKSQKSGKFRRTALTFFGVRKSICILPSFFGGRSKNQNKWSSKKGITKSRTHDGLSKGCHDDSRYTSAGDFEYSGQRDCAGELHNNCHNECIHSAADQKSLTLGRQKKGLRSLFHSFKHHRNHRNAGMDKTEMVAMSSPHCKKKVPIDQDSTNQYVTECLGTEPDVPDFADVICDISIGLECGDSDAVVLEKSGELESPKCELDDQMCDDQVEEMNLVAVVSSEYEELSRGHSEPCLKLQMTSEPVLKSETPTGSTDQLNLIFGDVASLKSFDSLTGCGDIIADQEDDSITESTVSGERSRNGGKRASCYLTYQGGGEEMASPEGVDEESIHEFWANNASEEICCTCHQDHTDLTADLTSTHNMDLLNSNSVHQASGMDTSSIADVLTPQSEHQESVPNSDEGYYDSTTPGQDEGQEKIDRLRTDRLPRDSYSGDALYELFAPDESLISPHYENKSKLPSSKECEYLSGPVHVTDSAFVPEMNRLQISPELYKVNDFLEMTSTDVFDEKGSMLASTEKRAKSMNAECEKNHSSISFGSTSDPDFETFCEPKEHDLEENKPVALPYKNIGSQSPDSNNDLDDGQTVCFSQALVDYTKHSQMLSNLCNSVDDLETNSAFTPNMEALPTIVTFDVVDMHNEGEYDEQIHMELEEHISSPYQEFEESYLQKDAFAACDYQIFDMYEQNLITNTWAVASLPRHLGLTRGSQSMPNQLSLDRRSRSLDTEGLELQMPDTYKENTAAVVSCPQTEKDSEGDSSPYYKNVLMSASSQKRSEMALSLPLTDGEISEKVQLLSQAQIKHKIHSTLSSSNFPNSESERLCSDVSDLVSCDLMSQNTDNYNRQCHLPLQSDSCSPHSTFVYSGMMEDVSDGTDDVFCKAASNLPCYNQSSKSRPDATKEGISQTGSPLNADMMQDEMSVISEAQTPKNVVRPMSCNKLPEESLN